MNHDDEMEELLKQIIGPRFSSRKNNVFKINYNEEICIIKIYNEEMVDRAQKEFRILRICQTKGILAPEPIELTNNAIIMSYIPGDNLHDVFNEVERKNNQSNREVEIGKILDLTAKWIADFHIATNFEFVRGDTILKNFIFSRNLIYGIDFEESMYKDPLFDIGQACAFILSLNPMFTERRFEEARLFSNRYWQHSKKNLSDRLPESISESLREMSKYRAAPENLLDWADKIQKMGKF